MNYAGIAAGIGCACVALIAQAAENFPVRPVRMIVAFTAGSETDFFARVVAQKMAEHWNQQVVVDNRPGAGGVLATRLVAAASPDGYTLFMNSMAHAITPAIYTNLPYDTLRDLTGIAQVSGVPNVLIVPPAQGVKTVKELIALAKQKPGQLTFGSAGVGSGMHINGEQFRLAADINVVHVAYKGGPEALTDVITGRVDFYFCPINTALPHIRDGRLIALVTSATTRAPELPDVPTTAEAGYKDADFPVWIGLMAPAKTPRPIIEKLHAETVKAIRLPASQEKLGKTGVAPMILTPAEFDARIRAEIAANGAVAKAAGIKPN